MVAVTILFALWFFGGAFIYFALIRQVAARPAALPDAPSPIGFGAPEGVLAGVLVLLLSYSVISAAMMPQPPEDLSSRAILASLFVTLAVVALIVVVLKARGRSVDALAGFSKLGTMRAVITGAILLMFAYPLIAVGDRIAQQLLRTGNSRQSIVEFFNSSQTIDQRIVIIIFAVTLAPAAEEFIFRFFLYGVLKRYFGLAFALVANAVLFAAVHGHLPSFVALFVLASCFTLAYEWSGSLLVSMTMHAIFNAMTLVVLAFPDTFQQ